MTARTGTYYAYRTPHGPVTIRVENGGITNVAFGDVELPGERRPSELASRAATELLEYFAGKRRFFDLPLAPDGSDFQLRVWDELARIPYGQSRTSAEVAAAIGSPGSYRMVGAAVRKNPIAVLVPDHRVTGTGGKPSGAGAETRLRAALLELERTRIARDIR